MRLEKDSLGEKEIPSGVYYGIQTLRAVENFPVSGRTERTELIYAYVTVKKAAVITNMKLGSLDNERGEAILKAADDVLHGKLADQFPVDLYQSGAGTSFNMNINEVLANRALEILNRNKGEYDYLSPNDHVNASQSSNDTFPTASHIAIIKESDKLYKTLINLGGSFKSKGKQLSDTPKSGRTHLMDAMPVTLGDEFIAYGNAIIRAAKEIHEKRNNLLEVAIGGTATGTGVNTPVFYRDNVVKKLAELTSLDLIPAKDSLEALQSRSQISNLSGALRELAHDLIRISNDLRLMGSGPTSGFAEINLPPVQPGSSIMPGKFNPVMAECLNMISFQIIGNDTTVSLAAQAGQFELNVMTPIMTSNILDSISFLNNYLPIFQTKCVEGITANNDRLKTIAEMNPSFATVLSPKIGYIKAAELVKQAMGSKKSIRDIVVIRGILSEEEADELLDLKTISKNLYTKE
ncbi:aspartate ammonia-lyase [Methanobacterium spitsbergense]|uniref:Aspartate ammonia-lyase n=1 Tax=Methanobacterium spitsbergense TaxID=2874285 RepID=A0A8T5V1F0_9EURY|nr:aspartate ammonia-lyase [Methanobacterium spitsbergense]MBZ2165671.1 aspartate ammonia-lyase [Methanobacterium spitsbergense]